MSRDYGDCLDSDQGGCEGETFERPSLSGSGMAFPRCDKHNQVHLDRISPKIERTRRRYPDSATPPEWFDESHAGERWNYDRPRSKTQNRPPPFQGSRAVLCVGER